MGNCVILMLRTFGFIFIWSLDFWGMEIGRKEHLPLIVREAAQFRFVYST